jgi:drug/metabolite transporter (DMT)-like permease
MGDGRRTVGVAIVANLVGGTSYVLTKIALGGLTETTLVVVRTVVALAVLLPWAGSRVATLLRAAGPDRRHLLAMAVLGYALPLVLGSYGLRRSTATNAALLIGTEPLSVVLLGAILLGEPLTRPRVIALGLGIVGATVLVANGIPLVTMTYTPHVAGDLLLLVHGVAWAVYTVAGKRLLGRYDAVAVSTASLLVALPFLVPPATLEARAFAWDAARLAPALGAAVVLGLVVSAGMTVLWNTALRHLDASRMAGFIFLQPLSGVVLAALLLGEAPSRFTVAGGVLILTGVYVLVQEERVRPRPRATGVGAGAGGHAPSAP